MKVKINLEDTYGLLTSSLELGEATFYSYDRTGNAVLLKICIKPVWDPLLPDVYNLCFGPPVAGGGIDDGISINHYDLNKLFSTIILFALTFLSSNPKVSIGLDGSDDIRAYLYHRIFIGNRKYFEELFVTWGVDWFVRLLRNDDYERTEDGAAFFKPKPEPFDYHKPARELYRYYMFHLKSKNSL